MSDPLHPFGRCSCIAEGTCDWCRRTSVTKYAAGFSQDGEHRYWLTRVWDEEMPLLVWVMLNPSRAGTVDDDHTVLKCVGFAKRRGCGGIVIVNLFGLVSTQPDRLAEYADPVGPDNDAWLEFWLNGAKQAGCVVVAAWGDSQRLLAGKRLRSVLQPMVERLGVELMCLGRTQHGSPRHPSRIGYNVWLKPLVFP